MQRNGARFPVQFSGIQLITATWYDWYSFCCPNISLFVLSMFSWTILNMKGATKCFACGKQWMLCTCQVTYFWSLQGDLQIKEHNGDDMQWNFYICCMAWWIFKCTRLVGTVTQHVALLPQCVRGPVHSLSVLSSCFLYYSSELSGFLLKYYVWCHSMDWHAIQGVFPPQCYQWRLWIHCSPDKPRIKPILKMTTRDNPRNFN